MPLRTLGGIPDSGIAYDEAEILWNQLDVLGQNGLRPFYSWSEDPST